VRAAAIGPYALTSTEQSADNDSEVKLMSASNPEPYCISIYLEAENTSAGPILKENLVYTKQQAESTFRV
jgi:hypothetical protein